jgi:hypothetical protein
MTISSLLVATGGLVVAAGAVAGNRPAVGLVSWARRGWVKMARVKPRRGSKFIPIVYPIISENRVVILDGIGLCQRDET